MRIRSKILTGSVAIAAAISLGLTGAAQAQATSHHSGNAKPAVTVTVPAGVATGVFLPNICPKGTAPALVSVPPLPANVKVVLPKAPQAVRIAGVFPAPPPAKYTITLTCPNGKKWTHTIKVAAAPAAGNVVGVGSDTIQNVFDQFSADYNHTHTSGQLYSWDATNPVSGVMGDPITTKSGCTAIPRPDGSSAGITALTTENGTTGGQPCMDFARSSRGRNTTTDPTSITFVTLAGDAVTYATQPGSNSPGNLTTADLTGIYNCTITKWNQIPGNSGGSTATIAAMLPQSGSGTRSFFLSAIGLTAPGSCVSTSATRQGAAGANDNTLQENEGVAPSLNMNTKNVIFPFSVGKYLAERYHSASCGTITQCFANPNNCTPNSKQNLFGCNVRGNMNLNMINDTNPTVPFPLTSKTTKAVTNPAFTPTFTRLLYEVVNSPEFSIPTYLQPYFSPTGWVCTNPTAKTDLKNYGFIVLPAGGAAGDCGSLS